MRSRSPLYHVDQIRRPALVTTGGQDTTVERLHADRFVEAMKVQQKPVIYLFYPNEGHDYERPESWRSFWAAAERFLHEHLGGRYEPVGSDFVGAEVKVVAGRDLIPGLPAGA
jgi:dipeptidyl aminopeptidase/acylaminoacyl peptidase